MAIDWRKIIFLKLRVMDFRKAVFQIYCVILYINHFSKEGISRYSCSPATHKRDETSLKAGFLRPGAHVE
jgi:hypothetical protein